MTESPAVRPPAPRVGPAWPLGLLVAVAAVGFFGYDLGSEPLFVDESAYIAQAYFFDLAVEGRLDDWAWVEYHAYDLPPLPKYLIGAALKVSGDRPPGRLAAGLWFDNTGMALATPRMLVAARWPSVILGAAGCVAIFSIGVQVQGRWAGLLAAGLLMANPLYRLHARRAMSDVPAEAFLLMTLAVGLWVWRRAISGRLKVVAGLGLSGIVGVLAGLAVLSKLNGGLALMTLIAWAALGLALRRFPIRGRVLFLALMVQASLVSLITFVTLNPFVLAHPKGPPPPRMRAPVPVDQSAFERLMTVIRHRASVSKVAQDRFPHNALRTPTEKFRTVIVQGFGRFGPFGPRDHSSTIPYPRYSWSRDLGAVGWLPMVLVGACWAAVNGWTSARSGRPPASWSVLAYFLIALATVSAFIPLAWDRYLLPIEAPSALLVSGAIGSAVQAVARRIRPEV